MVFPPQKVSGCVDVENKLSETKRNVLCSAHNDGDEGCFDGAEMDEKKVDVNFKGTFTSPHLV